VEIYLSLVSLKRILGKFFLYGSLRQDVTFPARDLKICVIQRRMIQNGVCVSKQKRKKNETKSIYTVKHCMYRF